MPNKDLTDIKKVAKRSQKEFFRFGMGLMFVVMIMIYTSQGMGLTSPQGIMLVVASMIGQAIPLTAEDALALIRQVGPDRWIARGSELAERFGERFAAPHGLGSRIAAA